MRLRPLNDNLVVKLDEDEWVGMNKPELVEIPESSIGWYVKKSRWGTIISWGNGCKNTYKIGEKVMFQFSSFRPGIKTEDGDCRIVMEQELLAKDEDVRP